MFLISFTTKNSIFVMEYFIYKSRNLVSILTNICGFWRQWRHSTTRNGKDGIVRTLATWTSTKNCSGCTNISHCGTRHLITTLPRNTDSSDFWTICIINIVHFWTKWICSIWWLVDAFPVSVAFDQFFPILSICLKRTRCNYLSNTISKNLPLDSIGGFSGSGWHIAINLTSSYTHLPWALHEPLIIPSTQTSPISGHSE